MTNGLRQPTERPVDLAVGRCAYLAGPINGCTDDQARGWREDAKTLLAAAGWAASDPMDRDYRGTEGEHFQEIVDADKGFIESADALLVMFERPSVGTSMEILWAWLDFKPVVLVDRSSGPLSPWLLAHVTATARSLEDGVALLGGVVDESLLPGNA